MGKIERPTLFSEYFGVEPETLEKAGLVDPFMEVDTPLFIDPILLQNSGLDEISKGAHGTFREHFTKFIRLLTISRSEGDAAWRAARRLLDLSEPPQNGLGYGGKGRSGASRPDDVRETIMRTCREIIDLGAQDPEMVSLMGFFEENVGPDTISDFTTRVIIRHLGQLTERFCQENNMPLATQSVIEGVRLPVFENTSGKQTTLVLVPRDIVRELPIANDWSDIESAAFENAQIRDRVNAFLGNIARPTIADRKYALKSVATGSKEEFEAFLSTVKEHATFYDPLIDGLGYYKLKDILTKGMDGLREEGKYDLRKGPEEVKRVALDALKHFRHHVENGNLWEELWEGTAPKKERAAQLIFFAIAECFCKANNVDISPEANMGGGPIDFKFSDGFNARVLVEIKRDDGTVRHGYETQLEIYKDASQTQFGIFVVMDYGRLGGKLRQIEKIRDYKRGKGEHVSDIIVIDGRKKKSASKRRL